MKATRRRNFFVDRIFQRKILILFLGINLIILIANILFYQIYLKESLELGLADSNIVITNISELVFDMIFVFNIAITIVILVMMIAFYIYVHMRLNVFFEQVVVKLDRFGQHSSEIPEADDNIPEEFEGFNELLSSFFRRVRDELSNESKIVQSCEELIN